MKLHFLVLFILGFSELFAQTFDKEILVYFNTDGGTENSIAAADFDNDGLKDVLMAGSSPNVFWVRNLGNNKFGPKITLYDDEIFGESAKPIDINNDGNIDVAAACSYSNVIVTLLGNGNGTFQEPMIIDGVSEPLEDLQIFDIDLDGYDDIAYSTYTPTDKIGKIYWLKNDGNGGFFYKKVIAPKAFGTDNIVFADLDNDNLPDLISKSFWDDKFTWFKNLGNGNFTEEIVIRSPLSSLGSHPLFAVNIDNDNDIDLLSYDNENISLYTNDGSGKFLISYIETTSFAWGIAASDFDHDGDIDIFCGSGEDELAVILHGNGDGTYQNEKVLANDIGQITGICISDMDNDGIDDVLTVSALYNGYLLFINNYDGPVLSTENSQKVEINIFPNPTADQIFINCLEPIISKIEVVDISGKRILTQSEEDVKHTEISLASLNKGYYVLIVKDKIGNIVSKHKLVVQ
jgi:hypothetical protein